MVAALAIGIIMVVVGCLAIIIGIPVKEFSLGNTLMLGGAIVITGGAVLIGVALAARELKAALLAGQPRTTARKLSLPGGAEESTAAVAQGPDTAADEPPGAPPWQDDAARARKATPTPPGEEPAPVPPPAEPAKPRRNLLFASTSRRERERAERQIDPAFAATETPAATQSEPRSPSFDEAWPEPSRGRETARRSRAAEQPSAASASPPAPAAPGAAAATGEDSAQVTVLKEGVVDGMAYKLFSDGSMEAQLPEGTMRFASIDELRSYLDQRG